MVIIPEEASKLQPKCYNFVMKSDLVLFKKLNIFI